MKPAPPATRTCITQYAIIRSVRSYEIVEHTADIGIRASGGTLEELFCRMAEGMFSLIAPPEQVRPTRSIPIRAEAADRERLLVAWLRELLYRFDTEHFLGRQFQIQRLEPTRLEATAAGETLDPARHAQDKEVKAVTYCDLSVRQMPDGAWTAQVIFDI